MKKNISIFLLLFLLAGSNKAQYCMLPGQMPYASLQPGITNFSLNTINRTSGNSESFTTVVVVTGLSTTLTAGQTYTISITHSEDYLNFPGARNNLRVWIDYNNNFSFLDAGETVLQANLLPPATTFTAAFTIPQSTPAGTLTLRATAKMSSDAGHITPSPCNSPNDPLGYHGEMEDYKLIVLASVQSQAPVSNFTTASNACILSSSSVTNNSTGSPAPTFSWIAVPSTGVSFIPNNTSATPQILFANAGTFSITCIATNSVSSNTSTKVIIAKNCSVSTEEDFLQENIQLTPNPASEFLTVKLPYHLSDAYISIIGSLGETLFEGNENSINSDVPSFNLSNLKNGIYFVKISLHSTSIVKKIIVLK
jgi:hypothetical protein